MANILITGGLGFIGSELANYLFPKNKITIFDQPRLEMSSYFRDIPLDLIDRKYGIAAIYDVNPDIIIHMGAKSSTNIIDPRETYYSNTYFTNRLIDYAIEKNKKLIYASSASTYGDGSYGFEDTDDFFKLQKFKPLNLYAWSKHNSDLYFSHQLHNNKNISNITSLKFFNVYGKNEIHKRNMASVISQKIPDIKSGKKVILYKHFHNKVFCEAKRDFIFVDDISRIIQIIIENDDKSTIYNLGSGISLPFSDLINAAFKILNLKPKIKFKNLPEEYHGKYQMRTIAPINKLKTLLKDFEFTPITHAIKKII